MPRKSTGASSAPGTPGSKAPRKSTGGEEEHVKGLVVPDSVSAVLRQQEVALKTLTGIESYELPRTNVIKTAKADIPDSVQLRKEVQQALVKSASVFISYITATAHDAAKSKGAKTINAHHVLEAAAQLELGPDAQHQLKAQLNAYRQNAQKKKETKKLPNQEDDGDADVSRVEHDEEADADQSIAVEGADADEGDQLMED